MNSLGIGGLTIDHYLIKHYTFHFKRAQFNGVQKIKPTPPSTMIAIKN